MGGEWYSEETPSEWSSEVGKRLTQPPHRCPPLLPLPVERIHRSVLDAVVHVVCRPGHEVVVDVSTASRRKVYPTSLGVYASFAPGRYTLPRRILLLAPSEVKYLCANPEHVHSAVLVRIGERARRPFGLYETVANTKFGCSLSTQHNRLRSTSLITNARSELNATRLWCFDSNGNASEGSTGRALLRLRAMLAASTLSPCSTIVFAPNNMGSTNSSKTTSAATLSQAQIVLVTALGTLMILLPLPRTSIASVAGECHLVF
eukprot:4928257-Pleurochrysis_carterae.AAC.4